METLISISTVDKETSSWWESWSSGPRHCVNNPETFSTLRDVPITDFIAGGLYEGEDANA